MANDKRVKLMETLEEIENVNCINSFNIDVVKKAKIGIINFNNCKSRDFVHSDNFCDMFDVIGNYDMIALNKYFRFLSIMNFGVFFIFPNIINSRIEIFLNGTCISSYTYSNDIPFVFKFDNFIYDSDYLFWNYELRNRNLELKEINDKFYVKTNELNNLIYKSVVFIDI